MTSNRSFLPPLVLLCGLAACDDSMSTINQFDPQAEAMRNTAPLTEPPPMMLASRTYRCRDNSLVYIDFFTNNTAQLRTEREGMPTILTAAEGNSPYVAEGYSVSANAEQISLTAPGKTNLSCRA